MKLKGLLVGPAPYRSDVIREGTFTLTKCGNQHIFNLAVTSVL